MIEYKNTNLTPEEARNDYLNEIVGILFIAQSHIENGVFDAEGFHKDIRNALEEVGREKAVCSFEEIYADSPELIEAQPPIFLAGTRAISEEFSALFQRGLLTEVDIKSFKERLERLRAYPETKVSLNEFMEIMAPEVAATTYVNEMSALYSVAKAMVEQRKKVRQLGVDEHILDFFEGFDDRLIVPFSERFQDEPEVFKTMPPEFVQAFDDLAEELNLHFREGTLTEDIVVQIFERMEAVKKRLIERL